MGLKNSEGDFLPWENEQKPKKPARVNIIPPKTSLSAKLLSTPTDEGREHLKLYLMSKEKERLEKFGSVLGKKLKRTAKAWREVTKTMAREMAKKQRGLPISEGLPTTETEPARTRTQKSPPRTSRMIVDY